MFEMKIEQILNALVDMELKRNRDPSKGLHVSFDVSMADYSVGNNFPEARGAIHLLYYVKPDRTYISVFSAFSKRFADIKKLDWKHEVTHDSCWRDISVVNRVYFDFAKSLNAKRLELGLAEKAPKDFSTNVFFERFGDPWKMIDVEISKDPSDTRNYRQFLKVL